MQNMFEASPITSRSCSRRKVLFHFCNGKIKKKKNIGTNFALYALGIINECMLHYTKIFVCMRKILLFKKKCMFFLMLKWLKFCMSMILKIKDFFCSFFCCLNFSLAFSLTVVMIIIDDHK